MSSKWNFEEMFRLALLEWPPRIGVDVIEHVETDPLRYAIEGLGATLEEIELKCIGTDGEVLWRHLHNAIYWAIHDGARFVTRIETAVLRVTLIRSSFEQDLREAAAKGPELLWRPEDYAAVREYFDENPKCGG